MNNKQFAMIKAMRRGHNTCESILNILLECSESERVNILATALEYVDHPDCQKPRVQGIAKLAHVLAFAINEIKS